MKDIKLHNHKKIDKAAWAKSKVQAPITNNIRVFRWKMPEMNRQQKWRKTEFKGRFFQTLWKDRLWMQTPLIRASLFKLQAKRVTGSAARLKNFCWFIGRGRANIRSVGMSRHIFYYHLRMGLLPGVTNLSRR